MTHAQAYTATYTQSHRSSTGN